MKRVLSFLNRLRKHYFKFILPNISILLTTRVSFRGYPICNQKLLLRGDGNIKIGKNCVFGYKLGGFYYRGGVELQARYKDSTINIGNKVATNNNLFLCSANYIEIGDETRIGQYVTIMDFEAHGVQPDTRSKVGEIGNIVIGKNVWIGNNVIILKNTIIGENSIVAAGAVVSGIFPKDVIIGGIPAKTIKDL